jgi:hypothetical protein
MPVAVDGLKECTECGETKPVSEYSKYKSAPDGFQYICKSCRRKYYQTNKEHVLKRAKKYREANKEKILEYHREHYKINRERTLEHKKKYYRNNNVIERHRAARAAQPAAVYEIKNKVTSRSYIGQTTALKLRWNKHKSQLSLGKHASPDLQRDYNEHGLDSFEFSVIQEYPCDTSREILFEHEQRLIDEYFAEGKDLYNIRTDA